MTYHGLLEYIRAAKECGASEMEISERLHKAGWYKVDVQDAFELYRRLTSTQAAENCDTDVAPSPSVLERVIPRHYDPHLIAVAAISFTIGFLAYVWLTTY